VDLWTQFEVDLDMPVVEHKMPDFRSGETFMECDKDVLVQKELKSRENRRTSKRSWQNIGRQIRWHIKPHTLQKSKLTSVEIPGADDDSWSRIDTKEQVEELLINRNIEQFLHAGDTQLTRPLDILHWTKSWDTQVAHLWSMISTTARWNIDH
jgi:hypothetical protein